MSPSVNTGQGKEFAELSRRAHDARLIGDADHWAGSPFEWILTQPSRTKGKIMEDLVHDWAEAQGFEVKRSSNSDADRIINGHRVEIKMSTLWATGVFRFQQIRDQDYDYCLCIGISPQKVQAWLLTKDILYQYVINHTPQHGGVVGKDTYWLSFDPEKLAIEKPWLQECGGTLEQVASMIQELGYGPY